MTTANNNNNGEKPQCGNMKTCDTTTAKTTCVREMPQCSDTITFKTTKVKCCNAEGEMPQCGDTTGLGIDTSSKQHRFSGFISIKVAIERYCHLLIDY